LRQRSFHHNFPPSQYRTAPAGAQHRHSAKILSRESAGVQSFCETFVILSSHSLPGCAILSPAPSSGRLCGRGYLRQPFAVTTYSDPAPRTQCAASWCRRAPCCQCRASPGDGGSIVGRPCWHSRLKPATSAIFRNTTISVDGPSSHCGLKSDTALGPKVPIAEAIQTIQPEPIMPRRQPARRLGH
jgi:hypothetical protein